MTILYPHGYGRTLVTLDRLFELNHEDKMHPEYARRLRAWLVAQGGRIGIGGSWRDTGTQPDQPGFAPEGKSFHQYQEFASGLIAFCAVDLVARNGDKIHRAPYWSEVPVQGSTEAADFGVHVNVGVPGNGESWHMQPIEIDGHDSWVANGRPEPTTTIEEFPFLLEDDMAYKFIKLDGYQDQFLVLPVSGETKRRMNAVGTAPLPLKAAATRSQLEEFFGYELTP